MSLKNRDLVEFLSSTKHKGEHIIVCGLGKSILELDVEWLKSQITIGVNDVNRLFTPNYLVLLDNANRFASERWQYIKSNQTSIIFSQLHNEYLKCFKESNVVKINLSNTQGACLDENNLGISYTSPFVAVEIAYLLGAKHISLIGVDFTEDHFFAQTGKHALNSKLPKILEHFRELKELLNKEGVLLDVLTENSSLTQILPITLNYQKIKINE